MSRHWETMLYTYAVALTQGRRIARDNLAGIRRKTIRMGHTEGECQCVESNPHLYIRTGKFASHEWRVEE